MVEPLLRIESVTAGYDNRPVMRGLSLDVRAGELLGLLGANGCGKTTVLRVAAGVLRPLSGRVTLDGVDLSESAPRLLARRIATLPQDAGPAFNLSVLETVLLGRYPWRPPFAFESEDDIAAAHAALDAVEAKDLAHRDLGSLSGGERQRALLARALCQGGDVLLCDEPTAHLDLPHQSATFRLLRRLAGDGRAVVVATHDLNLAAQACDRIALLCPGGLVATGTPSDVITPEHLETAFDIAASVEQGPGGAPFVVRHL